MSLFKRALGGAASAGVAITNKYIDEQLASSRAKMLSDLQFEQTKRLDDYNLSPERQGRITAAEAERERKVGTARNETALAGKRAEAGDKELTQAQIDRANTTLQGTMGAEAERSGMIAEANAKAGAKYRQQPTGSDDPFAKLPAAVKVAYAGIQKQADQINAAIVKAQADGMWEPEKNKAQADLMIRLRVLNDEAESLIKPHLPKQPGEQDNDKAIRDLLLGKGDVKPGAAPSADLGKPAKPVMQRAEEAAKDPITTMDERMLKRIAAIEGHAKQKEAKAELDRRAKQKSAEPEVDTNQFGFGTPGA